MPGCKYERGLTLRIDLPLREIFASCSLGSATAKPILVGTDSGDASTRGTASDHADRGMQSKT